MKHPRSNTQVSSPLEDPESLGSGLSLSLGLVEEWLERQTQRQSCDGPTYSSHRPCVLLPLAVPRLPQAQHRASSPLTSQVTVTASYSQVRSVMGLLFGFLIHKWWLSCVCVCVRCIWKSEAGTFWAAATLKTGILSWLFMASVCFFLFF